MMNILTIYKQPTTIPQLRSQTVCRENHSNISLNKDWHKLQEDMDKFEK